MGPYVYFFKKKDDPENIILLQNVSEIAQKYPKITFIEIDLSLEPQYDPLNSFKAFTKSVHLIFKGEILRVDGFDKSKIRELCNKAIIFHNEKIDILVENVGSKGRRKTENVKTPSINSKKKCYKLNYEQILKYRKAHILKQKLKIPTDDEFIPQKPKYVKIAQKVSQNTNFHINDCQNIKIINIPTHNPEFRYILPKNILFYQQPQVSLKCQLPILPKTINLINSGTLENLNVKPNSSLDNLNIKETNNNKIKDKINNINSKISSEDKSNLKKNSLLENKTTKNLQNRISLSKTSKDEKISIEKEEILQKLEIDSDFKLQNNTNLYNKPTINDLEFENQQSTDLNSLPQTSNYLINFDNRTLTQINDSFVLQSPTLGQIFSPFEFDKFVEQLAPNKYNEHPIELEYEKMNTE